MLGSHWGVGVTMGVGIIMACWGHTGVLGTYWGIGVTMECWGHIGGGGVGGVGGHS